MRLDEPGGEAGSLVIPRPDHHKSIAESEATCHRVNGEVDAGLVGRGSDDFLLSSSRSAVSAWVRIGGLYSDVVRALPAVVKFDVERVARERGVLLGDKLVCAV
ncbi:hypothetical protein [Micromonospora parva]|uniref:hypothetical protein n=1 Tax=Micromonospora parva TaxID=1464048 RepID=UPI00340DFC9D